MKYLFCLKEIVNAYYYYHIFFSRYWHDPGPRVSNAKLKSSQNVLLAKYFNTLCENFFFEEVDIISL